MERGNLLGRALLAGLAALLAVAACGERRQPSITGFQPAVSLAGAFAELEGMECPEGVEAELWAELKDALKEALAGRVGRGFIPADEETARLKSRPTQGVRLASTPPTGEANRVNDLSISDNGDGTYTLTWHYRNLGDYGQDGTVGVADITPLAQHFGEAVPPEDADTCNSIPAVIDGSGNGKVGIEDVTQIARYYGAQVADYLLEGATALEGPFGEVEAVPAEEAIGADTERAHFARIFTPGEDTYFRVVARDAAGTRDEPSNTVGLSLQILSVTPTEVKEGTVVTFSAEVLGAGPLQFAWDFGGGAQYEIYTEASPRVVLTRETGEFPATLTVTGPTGNAAYPFTLTKLAREWRYEVIPGVYGGPRLLKVVDESAWFVVSQGIPFEPWTYSLWSVAHGAVTCHYTGPCSQFDRNSQGTVAVFGFEGWLVDFSMVYSEFKEGQWKAEVVASGLTRGYGEFRFAWSDVPLVVYENRYWEPETTFDFRFAWRTNDGWRFGIIDDAGGPGGKVEAPLGLSVDSRGIPATCHRVLTNPGIFPPYYELRYASCGGPGDEWRIRTVEAEEEDGDADVGVPADIAHDHEDRVLVAYARRCPDPGPGAYVKRITLAADHGGFWQRAEVRQWDYRTSILDLSLGCTPLDEVVVLYAVENADEEAELDLSWQHGSSFQHECIAEGVRYGSLFVDESGTVYVLFRDSTLEEVVLARYE